MFYCFPTIIGFDISYKLSPRETFLWNVKAYWLEKIYKKNIINLSSAEFAQRVVKVKYSECKDETLYNSII